MEKETLANANEVLKRMVSTKDSRIRYGRLMRRHYWEEIAKGKNPPANYRTNFLRLLEAEFFKLIVKKGEEFNNYYLQDMLSVDDMLDVLNIVALKLRKHS